MAPLRKVTPRYRCTPEEYFAIEKSGEELLEYVNGDIVDKSGTSLEHNYIVGNIIVELKGRFLGSPRHVYALKIRVRVSDTHYCYPDVVALCGETQTAPTTPPILLNPMAVFEVLSPFTQDKGDKFDEYIRTETLNDYVLAAQDSMSIRHYRRLNEKDWQVSVYTKPEDIIRLESLDVTLTLADIYSEIVFPAPPKTKRRTVRKTPS